MIPAPLGDCCQTRTPRQRSSSQGCYVSRVKRALQILEDQAVNEVADDDVLRYSVVRVADEVVVDLMARACGVDYADASTDLEMLTVGGASIPVASLRTLIRTKNTTRPSDASDRLYLEELLKATRHED